MPNKQTATFKIHYKIHAVRDKNREKRVYYSRIHYKRTA